MKLIFAVLCLTWLSAPAAADVSCLKALENGTGPTSDSISQVRACLPAPGTAIVDGRSLRAYGANLQAREEPGTEPQGRAFRISVSNPSQGPWANGVSATVGGDIRKGDTIVLALFVRALSGCGGGQFGVVSEAGIQLNRKPWTIIAGSGALVPSDKWSILYVSRVAEIDAPKGSAFLQVHLGGCQQTLIIGPVMGFDLGPNVSLRSMPPNEASYPNRSESASWRQAALARIDDIRKGAMRISVLDPGGHPVSGAMVHVAQQRHQFHFGGFAGALVPHGDGISERARAVFLSEFNFATAPFYWSDWGWQVPEVRKRYLSLAQWLNENGYPWRAHPILYPNRASVPTNIVKLGGRPLAVREAVIDHVGTVLSDILPYQPVSVDLLNEPRGGSYLEEIAGKDIVARAFAEAHRSAPRLAAFVNENGIIDSGGLNEYYIRQYRDWVAGKLNDGVQIDGIGIQAHFGSPLTDPAQILTVLNSFAAFKLPIEITEFDIDSPDEQAQADYTRDFLIVAFSHPAVVGVVAWGWADLTHDTGMFRRDWSRKPNGVVWSNLVHHYWWTDEKVVTSPNGVAETRAFYGDYVITAAWSGHVVTRQIKFDKNSPTVVLQ